MSTLCSNLFDLFFNLLNLLIKKYPAEGHKFLYNLSFFTIYMNSKKSFRKSSGEMSPLFDS